MIELCWKKLEGTHSNDNAVLLDSGDWAVLQYREGETFAGNHPVTFDPQYDPPTSWQDVPIQS